MTTPSVTVHRLGTEGEAVAVIDNFAPDPNDLCTAASQANFEGAGAHYPGIRAPVPAAYLPAVRPMLGKVLREVFGLVTAVSVIDVRFAIVTTDPAALSLEQRLPHVDALEPGRLALVHYLARGDTDGTSFYRHRTTGFETITAPRSERYFAALNADLRNHCPPPAYLRGDTPIFESIGCFAGRFNRALVYRSRLLHSGDISPGRTLSADPAQGRLTVTGFFAGQ